MPDRSPQSDRPQITQLDRSSEIFFRGFTRSYLAAKRGTEALADGAVPACADTLKPGRIGHVGCRESSQGVAVRSARCDAEPAPAAAPRCARCASCVSCASCVRSSISLHACSQNRPR